jgi:hypothetical protein
MTAAAAAITTSSAPLVAGALLVKAVHRAPPLRHLGEWVGGEGEQLSGCCKARYEGAVLGGLFFGGEQQLGAAVRAGGQALLLVALAGLMVLLV